MYTSIFSFLVNSSFYAKSIQPLAIRQEIFMDANCTTLAASSSDFPNPIVANLNECMKISSSGPVTVYYKSTSCVSGGKAEGFLFTDSACSVNAGQQISTDTDKCIPSEKGGFQVTCNSAADPGAFEEIIQNVTDSIIYAFEKSFLLPKGALFSILSDYQITLPKFLFNQSVVVERSLLLFSMNATARTSLGEMNAFYSHAVNSFRSNTRNDEIRNLVTPATLSVRPFKYRFCFVNNMVELSCL